MNFEPPKSKLIWDWEIQFSKMILNIIFSLIKKIYERESFKKNNWKINYCEKYQIQMKISEILSKQSNAYS